MKQNLLSCVVFVIVVILGVDRGGCCPTVNVSVEQLLEGNPYLKSVYDELGPQGFLSADGLRELLKRLLVKTTCPMPPLKMEKLDLTHDGNHAHDNLDHKGDHADHDHHNHEDDHIDHDHRKHEDSDNHDRNDDKSHNRSEHDHVTEGDSGIDNDHRAMKNSNRSGQMNKGNMIGPESNEKGYGDKEQMNNMEESTEHLKEEPSDVSVIPETCDSIEEVISVADVERATALLPEDFLHICPAILNSILGPPCRSLLNREGLMNAKDEKLEHGYNHQGHNHHHRHENEGSGHMARDAWLAATLSLILIGLIAFCCIMVIPVMKRSKYYVLINHFLLALAVGSLAGDALIHLLPHAMTMEIKMSLNGHLVHALYGFTSFAGILLFLLLERAHDVFGHKHSHGHSHDTSATVDGDEFIKEIGIISAELNEVSPHRFDKIGEKLSQHSKHSSFVFAESNTSPSEGQRGCFESCPPNLGTGLEDANGNNGNIDSMVCKPRLADHNSGSVAECERLVNSQSHDKNEQISSSKTQLAPIPPPPLVVQSSPPKSLVRQDSNNFNMVLQEYHVGHHGHSHHGHSHVTDLHELMLTGDSTGCKQFEKLYETNSEKRIECCHPPDSVEDSGCSIEVFSKKDSLRTMILLGDGMHSFMDGMAIGAAFGTSLTGGIATAIAVLCHELPHKVGDFAILFEMGMKRRQAMKMVVVLWILSIMGMALGVSIGTIQEVSPWIYCFTAGIFLYLALVDLLSELSINDTDLCSGGNQMALQVAGMMTGALIMLLIAIYEHDLEHILEGTF